MAPARFLTPSWWRRLFGGPIGRVLLLLVFAVAMLASFQRTLIYFPHQVSLVQPEEAGWTKQRCQLLEIVAQDQIVLHGWLILAEGQAAQCIAEFDQQLQHGRPLILYFCGNGGHRGYRQSSLRTLAQLGCDVVICDYRGYGDNAGSPNEKHFVADAHAIWKYLTDVRHVESSRIILYGESLGGGVATALAAELCRAGMEPGGLIVQSTFPSLVAAGQFHYPWLPVGWLLLDRFSSTERMSHVTCPVLQIHGRRDTIVPWKLGEKLYAAISAESSRGLPKSRIELPETDHNDVYDFDSPDRELLVNGLGRWLAALNE